MLMAIYDDGSYVVILCYIVVIWFTMCVCWWPFMMMCLVVFIGLYSLKLCCSLNMFLMVS